MALPIIPALSGNKLVVATPRFRLLERVDYTARRWEWAYPPKIEVVYDPYPHDDAEPYDAKIITPTTDFRLRMSLIKPEYDPFGELVPPIYDDDGIQIGGTERYKPPLDTFVKKLLQGAPKPRFIYPSWYDFGAEFNGLHWKESRVVIGREGKDKFSYELLFVDIYRRGWPYLEPATLHWDVIGGVIPNEDTSPHWSGSGELSTGSVHVSKVDVTFEPTVPPSPFPMTKGDRDEIWPWPFSEITYSSPQNYFRRDKVLAVGVGSSPTSKQGLGLSFTDNAWFKYHPKFPTDIFPLFWGDIMGIHPHHEFNDNLPEEHIGWGTNKSVTKGEIIDPNLPPCPQTAELCMVLDDQEVMITFDTNIIQVYVKLLGIWLPIPHTGTGHIIPRGGECFLKQFGDGFKLITYEGNTESARTEYTFVRW